MARLLRIANIVLTVLLFGTVRAAFRFPIMGERYAAGALIILAVAVVLNVAYFVTVKRRQIADHAIGAAASGVRAKRAIGSKLAVVRQQVIDRADRS